ncbi:MAG: OprD family outer membrane porin, partial [Candidatus Thiodiazotropha endolucinida]
MEKTRLTTFGAERVPAGISFVERKRVFDQLFRVVGTQNRVTQPVRCHRNTFLPDSERSLPKRMVQTGLLSGVLFGLSGVATVQAEEGVFGNFRLGVIHAEDETGNETDGSAIGGKLGYISPTWKGLSTSATFYTTGELFDDENGDFFSSENASYAILGEAYIQAEYSNTALRVGRFELDTPHADTDDIRMVPNTFQGLLLSNSDIAGTTLYLTHLDKWAGVDADIPESFRELNADDGLTAVGAVFEGIEQLTLQGWYYQGSNFAELFYLEGMYETDAFSIGLQIGSQSDDTGGESGPDGDVWGITGSYTLADFTITAAYNDVSGRVTNGFGGGPYFTSADDHAIDGVEDQEATA